MKTEVSKNPGARTLTFTRVFDAPREKVFAAFAKLDQLEQWWTPPGFHPETKSFDFKSGGNWHYNAVGTYDGERIESWTKRVFQEITEPEKIVVEDAFSDPEGGTAQNMPQSIQTFTFTEQGNQTKLEVSAVYNTDESYEKILGMQIVEGIDETFSQLEAFLNK